MREHLENAKSWTPEDKAKLFFRCVEAIGELTGQELLFAGSEATLDAIMSGIDRIEAEFYAAYKEWRDARKDIADFPNGTSEQKARCEVRYQFERLRDLFRQRSIPGQVKLTVSDRLLDEWWDKAAFTYTVENYGTAPICDFKIQLENNAQGEMADASEILRADLRGNDRMKLPPDWAARFDGNTIIFETTDPKRCIKKGDRAAFEFQVFWRNFSPLGTVSTIGSELAKAAHKDLPGTKADGLLGPVASVRALGAPVAGSMVYLTGSVVGGQATSVTVVSPDGVFLEGVVMTASGEQKKTDSRGRATFLVPLGVTAFSVGFPAITGGPRQQARVVHAVPGTAAAAPSVTHAPSYVTAGSAFHVEGTSFSGNVAGDTATAGGRDLKVLASSPVELVLSSPPDMPLGDSGPLVISTNVGRSAPRKLQFVRMRLQSGNTRMIRGQDGTAQVIMEGTSDRVPVRIENVGLDVIDLVGGNVQNLISSGGEPNIVTLRFHGTGTGTFRINATIPETRR